MDFDNYNKYIITYSSPVPVRGGFYCEINGNRSFEEFYLEPTGEGRFCSFIEGYIDGMTAKNVENLSFKACRGNENEDGNGNGNGAENGFELRGIAVELVPVPAGGRLSGGCPFRYNLKDPD